MSRSSFLAIIILAVTLVACKEEAPPSSVQNSWEGTWHVAWFPGYKDPEVCVKLWRTRSGDLVGTRNRAGGDSLCSLIEGELLEEGRVWKGQERTWDVGGDPAGGKVSDFYLVISKEGNMINGLRTMVNPADTDYVGPRAWWGIPVKCTPNNEDAWKDCGYPE